MTLGVFENSLIFIFHKLLDKEFSLSTKEFFERFFSDNATFSLKQFHEGELFYKGKKILSKGE